MTNEVSWQSYILSAIDDQEKETSTLSAQTPFSMQLQAVTVAIAALIAGTSALPAQQEDVSPPDSSNSIPL